MNLIYQRLDFVCAQSYVVDANIINRAGEESPGFEIPAGTNLFFELSNLIFDLPFRQRFI